MATKTQTKQQREAAQKAALRRRIADCAVGAAGFNFDTEDEFATADMLSRWVPALKALFGDGYGAYLWDPMNIHHFDRIDSATEFLWNNGVRP